jgi:hypothetical protein
MPALAFRGKAVQDPVLTRGAACVEYETKYLCTSVSRGQQPAPIQGYLTYKKTHPLGPYMHRRPMFRVLGGPRRVVVFLWARYPCRSVSRILGRGANVHWPPGWVPSACGVEGGTLTAREDLAEVFSWSGNDQAGRAKQKGSHIRVGGRNKRGLIFCGGDRSVRNSGRTASI